MAAKGPKLTRRSDGYYQVECRYKKPDGTPGKKSFYGKTQEEANRARDEFKRQLEQNSRLLDKSMTVKAYVEQWLANYQPTVKPITYENKQSDTRTIIDAVGGRPISSIVRSDIQAIVNLRAGKSQSYVHKLQVTCNQVFTSAYLDGLMPTQPCFKIKMPENVKGSHRQLTEEEIKLLVEHYQEAAMGELAMVMLFTGLRPNEARALQPKHIDLKARKIHVRDTLSYCKNEIVMGDPKSKAGFRDIPIFNPVYPILARRCKAATTYLFTMKGSDKPISEASYRRGINSILYVLSYHKNGFHHRWAGKREWNPVHFTPYDLRHTFCTLCRDAGVDIKVCMQWMGHADSKLILEIYDHSSKGREQLATDHLNAYVGKFVGIH